MWLLAVLTGDRINGVFWYNKMHGRFAGPKKASRNNESKAEFYWISGLPRVWTGFGVTRQIRWDSKLRDYPIVPLRRQVVWDVRNSHKLCTRYG